MLATDAAAAAGRSFAPLLLPLFVPVAGCWRVGSSLLLLWLLLPTADAIVHYPMNSR
jgi:hypothetical protein